MCLRQGVLIVLLFRTALLYAADEINSPGRIELSYSDDLPKSTRNILERSYGLPRSTKRCKSTIISGVNKPVFCYSVPIGEEQFWVDALSASEVFLGVHSPVRRMSKPEGPTQSASVVIPPQQLPSKELTLAKVVRSCALRLLSPDRRIPKLRSST